VREIRAKDISSAAAGLIRKASFELPADVLSALSGALKHEDSPLGRDVLERLIENAATAGEDGLPLCQDCGTAVFFIELGQDVHVTEGSLIEAIAEGTRQGYMESYLRASMVSCPFSSRVNTGDNTPPVIHTEIIPGDTLKISFMPKGGGAENMSKLFMLKPGAGYEGVISSVIATVKDAGGKACPPLIIGLGIGGISEEAMLMAKKALLRPVGQASGDPEVALLERDALAAVNRLGIGPLGMGGNTTALAVHAIAGPCHFASLPLAVNLQCHSARHVEVTI
jgi:fumarate hydratase subunit alpha